MNDKLTPIWDELSAIGESAPPRTWDGVPTNLSTLIESAYQDYAKCISDDKQKTFEINILVPENRALRAEIERLTAVITYMRQGGGVAIHGTGGIGDESGQWRSPPSIENKRLKADFDETLAEDNPLLALAKFGREVLYMLELNDYSDMDGETMKKEAIKLGLLDELDALTSKAKVLDVDP